MAAAASASTTTAAGSFTIPLLNSFCFLGSQNLSLYSQPFYPLLAAAALPRVGDWSAEVEEEEERIQHEQQNRTNRERGIIRLPQPAAESLRYACSCVKRPVCFQDARKWDAGRTGLL